MYMCLHIHVHACMHTHTYIYTVNKITLIRLFPDRSCSIEYIVERCVFKAFIVVLSLWQRMLMGQEVLSQGPMSRCKHTDPEQTMLKTAIQAVNGCCPGTPVSCAFSPHPALPVGSAS